MTMLIMHLWLAPLLIFVTGHSLSQPPSELVASLLLNGNSPRSVVSDSLFQLAERCLARGDMKAAEEAYRTLVKEGNDPRAYVGLGKILVAREKWNEAKVQLDEAIELDPNSVEAWYYAGVNYRELGRWRGGSIPRGISQGGAYVKSGELLRAVIQRDSSYRDVLYQYALLLKDQEQYGDAMMAMCAQLRRTPTPPVAYPALVRLIRGAIHEGRGTELLPQIQRPFEDLELYVRAEMLRTDGRLVEAEQLLSQLLQRPVKIPPQLAYLSLVRIYAQKGMTQQLEETYWEAVREIKSEAGAALVLEDLKYILSQQEVTEYINSSIELKRSQVLPSVWNRRNPTLASLSNPRLPEHYQRLLYAEENYYLDRERFSFIGSKGLPSPDFEFKDIGLIYIRHGLPSEILRATGEGVRTVESWLYNASEEAPELMFHFYGAEKSFSSVGSLGTQAQATMTFKQLPVGNPTDKATGSVRPANVGPGAGSRLPLAPDLAFWNPNYFSASMGDPGAMSRIAEEAGRTRSVGLTTERYTAPKNMKYLQIPNAISAFRSRAGKTLLEVAYFVPGLALLKEAGDSVRNLSVENGFAVYDTHWRKIFGVAETLTVSRADPKTQADFRLHRLYVKPDSYYVAFFARPKGVDLLGKSELTVRAPNFGSAALTMSDIQLALEIRSDSIRSLFYKDGLRVVVNPTHKHSVQRPLYTYFEIYNAAKDARGRTNLELDMSMRPSNLASGIFSGIAGLLGKKEGFFVSSEVERVKSDGALVKYLAMDVTRMQPGEYVLEIRITDKLANEKVTRAVPIEFYGTNASKQ